VSDTQSDFFGSVRAATRLHDTEDDDLPATAAKQWAVLVSTAMRRLEWHKGHYI